MHGYDLQINPVTGEKESCMDCTTLEKMGMPEAASYCRRYLKKMFSKFSNKFSQPQNLKTFFSVVFLRLPDVQLMARAAEQVNGSMQLGAQNIDNLAHDSWKFQKDVPARLPEPLVFLEPMAKTAGATFLGGAGGDPLLDPLLLQIKQATPSEDDYLGDKLHAALAGKMPDDASIAAKIEAGRHPIGHDDHANSWENLLRSMLDAKNTLEWVNKAKANGDLAIMKRLVMKAKRTPAPVDIDFAKDPNDITKNLSEMGAHKIFKNVFSSLQ